MRILAAALLVICGIGTTACDKLGLGDDDNPTSPTNPTPSSPVRYTPVGASDVLGIGSTSPCIDFFGDCPMGKGAVDWAWVSKTIREAKFQGPISLHFEYEIPGSTPREQTKNTLAAAVEELAFARKFFG